MPVHAPEPLSQPVVAVDLGGTKIAAAVASARGTLSDRFVEPVDASSRDSVVRQIVSIARPRLPGARALGVAVPGLVRRDGSVWAPNLPEWERVPLAAMLSNELSLPVVVESDRNAAVLGEAWAGAARGRRDVVVLILGTGIGAGIISGGRVVRGAHELSGCAGWLVVTEKEGEAARRSGSLEALVGGPALGRIFRSDSAEAVAIAARRGDRSAKEIFANAGHLLGLAVANIISLFDPEVIVLTGGLTQSADLFIDQLKRTTRERAQPLSAPSVDIIVSSLQSDANLLGVGSLALNAVPLPDAGES